MNIYHDKNKKLMENNALIVKFIGRLAKGKIRRWNRDNIDISGLKNTLTQ